MDDLIKAAVSGDSEEFARIFKERLYESIKKKRWLTTMKVEYNGYTGELVKLCRTVATVKVDGGMINAIYKPTNTVFEYELSIYDSEKKVTHSFAGVRLDDVKFFGGAVSFGG